MLDPWYAFEQLLALQIRTRFAVREFPALAGDPVDVEIVEIVEIERRPRQPVAAVAGAVIAVVPGNR